MDMDAANERELTMQEWKEWYAALPETELNAPAAELIAEERRIRDGELSACSGYSAYGERGMDE